MPSSGRARAIRRRARASQWCCADCEKIRPEGPVESVAPPGIQDVFLGAVPGRSLGVHPRCVHRPARSDLWLLGSALTDSANNPLPRPVAPIYRGYQSLSNTSIGSPSKASRKAWIVAAIASALSGRGWSRSSNQRAVALS